MTKIIDELEKSVKENEFVLKLKLTEMNEMAFCNAVCNIKGDIEKAIKLEKVESSEKGQTLRWNCLRYEIIK